MRILKIGTILSAALCLAASWSANAADKTPYEKIFDGKKSVKTVESFMKMHLLDGSKLVLEIPADIMGRSILVTSAVEKTSDGGEGSIGYLSPKSMHVEFCATDSLILLKEVSAYRYMSNDKASAEAVKKSHSGAVIATFPIEARSADSAYVFDVTSFFKTHDKRLDPVDPNGMNSYGGLVNAELDHDSSMSMLSGIQAFTNSLSVMSYETYSISKTVLGMKSGDGEFLTVLLRKSLYLLPEKAMRPRIADDRIGVRGRSFMNFLSTDKGSEIVWYAERYDAGRDGVTFYVDTLFTQPFYDAIEKGIKKWNAAFAGIGKPDFIDVRRYPSVSEDPEFDANDMRFSCVKYEPVSNSVVKSSCWTDPRSGEIISSSIYIPFDIMTTLQAELLLSLGASEPSVRTAANTSPLLFEALQSIVTNRAGSCLGLAPNLMASMAVPADSLRSVTYTRDHGLSASVMDDVPYNFFAKEGDGARGVRLINTEVGPYDKFVIKWLYGTVPGADTPEAEVKALDKLITESRSDRNLAFGRFPSSRADATRGMDPRLVSWDLGDDDIASVQAKFDNLSFAVSHLSEWIGDTDPDYSFRPNLNTVLFNGICYSLVDLLGNVGGFYLTSRKSGDDGQSYVAVPAEKQKRVFNFVMDQLDDLSWVDNSDTWRDMIFVRSFGDYFTNILYQNVLDRLKVLSFSETVSENPYTRRDAYNDLIDHVLKKVKEGKDVSENDLAFQYSLLGYTMQTSNADYSPSGRASLREVQAKAFAENAAKVSGERGDVSGFSTQTSIDFLTLPNVDYLDYEKLLEIRKIYVKAAKRTSDRRLKAKYEYLVMAVDRLLK